MQSYVTDEKGEYVKAAIIRLYKKNGDAGSKDPADETEVITYAETDEEGRFLIQDLDPEEKYCIEIHIDHSGSEPAAGEDEPESDEDEPESDEEDRIEDKDIADSPAAKTLAESTARETVCINCCCNYKTAVDLKAKPYLTKTNLW